MIRVLEQDILLAGEQIIVHQVNCQGVMNKGIAEQIRKKYPSVYNHYKTKVNNFKKDNHQHLLLGSIQFVKVETDKWVCNLFGQERYGYNELFTSYCGLREALIQLKRVAIKREKSIAIPYFIGSGLAGGDINKIHQIIRDVFNDYPVSLYRLENK